MRQNGVLCDVTLLVDRGSGAGTSGSSVGGGAIGAAAATSSSSATATDCVKSEAGEGVENEVDDRVSETGGSSMDLTSTTTSTTNSSSTTSSASASGKPRGVGVDSHRLLRGGHHFRGGGGGVGGVGGVGGSVDDEVALPVHKLVLVAASPFFRSHFNQGSLDDDKFKLQIPQVRS